MGVQGAGTGATGRFPVTCAEVFLGSRKKNPFTKRGNLLYNLPNFLEFNFVSRNKLPSNSLPAASGEQDSERFQNKVRHFPGSKRRS
jgi:hypothetical protein